MSIDAYPLTWPAGYARTPKGMRKSARFDTSFSAAKDGILEELRRLRATDVIISTDIPLRKDGTPYSADRMRTPDDIGVAVYFTHEKQQVVLACDKWDDIADNMQAIRKAIEAIRGLDRWGVSDMLKRAFTGFKALPQTAGTSNRPWWEVLDVHPNASAQQIKAARNEKVRHAHPDTGGSQDQFVIIQQAYEEGMAARS